MSSNTKNNTSQKSLRFFGTFLAVFSLITLQTSTVLADAKEGGYPEAKELKTIQWKWSDGVAGSSRALSKSKFKSASNLPLIVVTIKPISIHVFGYSQLRYLGAKLEFDSVMLPCSFDFYIFYI